MVFTITDGMEWVRAIAENMRMKNEREVISPADADVDAMLFVLRCLANPRCDGSDTMLNTIIERRKQLV